MVLDRLRRGGLAIHIELHTAGATRAVVGDADLHPFVERELGCGADLDGVARPEINQAEAGVSVFEHELVALIAGIGPGLLMVHYHNLGKLLRDLHPQAERKRIGAGEVGDPLDGDGVLAVEVKRAACFAGDDPGLFSELAREVRADAVGRAVVGDCIKRVVADESFHFRQRRSLALPLVEGFVSLLLVVAERGFLPGDLFLHRSVTRFLGVVLVEQRGGAGDRVGEVRVEAGLLGRVEEREEPIVILLRDGIVFVVVAAGAFHREPEKRAGRRVNPVGVVLHAELFIHAAPFICLAMQAVEGRRGFLIARGVGQQVAGDLFDDEVVEADVSVEGVDDPIPPRPEMIEAIRLVTVGVGVARDIEPLDRHPLTVGW